MNLTDEERKKFAAYCYQEAESSKQMIKAMTDNNLPIVVIEHEKRLLAAHMIVFERLNNVEKFTIGG